MMTDGVYKYSFDDIMDEIFKVRSIAPFYPNILKIK